jgi:hypothetical protein
MPADLFGISDRGRIAIGQAADLILFDQSTVGRGGRAAASTTSRRCGAPSPPRRAGSTACGSTATRIADERGLTRDNDAHRPPAAIVRIVPKKLRNVYATSRPRSRIARAIWSPSIEREIFGADTVFHMHTTARPTTSPTSIGVRPTW